jgi:hypothetical protein
MRRCAAPVIVYYQQTRAALRVLCRLPARAAQLHRADSIIGSTIIKTASGFMPFCFMQLTLMHLILMPLTLCI